MFDNAVNCSQSQARSLADVLGGEKGLKNVFVAVNVSTRQFLMPGFVDQVAHILEKTGLPPDCLELEITESVLMQDADAAIKSLEDLRRLGLHLAIDDFGTGYSSLSYLSRFPFTTLKIDRAFIRDLENNPKDEEIVRAIIGLSRGLNLAVVGEGAEILEQVKFLRDHHCTSIQGYYYSKPVSPEEFELMLLNGIQVN